MAITVEIEKAIQAEHLKFYHSIKKTDPTYEGNQRNFQRLLDKVRGPVTKGGLGLDISVLGQQGGENIFVVAWQRCKADGTLEFTAPADPNANVYKPLNPWKTDSSPKGGIHNKENYLSESQATVAAVSDFHDGMRKLHEYLNTPDAPVEKAAVRQFPINISEKELRAAHPSKEELRLLDKQQRAALAAKENE